MRKASITLLLCMAAFCFSVVLQLNQALPVGKSCFRFNKSYNSSPSEEVTIATKSSMCGFFQNIRLDFDISYGKYVWEVTLFDNDALFDNEVIEWSEKSYFMWNYHLPKIVWKNNHEADIYIKNHVRYGEKTVTLDKTLDKTNGDKTDQAIIRFHYVLEN